MPGKTDSAIVIYIVITSSSIVIIAFHIVTNFCDILRVLRICCCECECEYVAVFTKSAKAETNAKAITAYVVLLS